MTPTLPKKRHSWFPYGEGKTYLDRVHWPLQCLVFISPLLVIYQIGSLVQGWHPDPQSPPIQLVAFVLILRFFSMFGAVGSYMPLMAVVGILLSLHLVRRDKWQLEPKLYLGMAAESIGWAVPALVIGLALLKYASPSAAEMRGLAQAGTATPIAYSTQAILSVGAGIYEELLFRLITIAVLDTILRDVFEMRVSRAIPIIIVTSAVLFSLYHALGMGPWGKEQFFYLTFIGVYFAGIFVYRGFGIVVGTHAVYDLLVIATEYMRHPHR